MKVRRFSAAALAATALATVLLVSRTVDVDWHWRDNDARAIDLFGTSEDKGTIDTVKPFWKDSKDAVPLAEAPKQASFADLAEHVSPAVVSIRTSKTVNGQGQHGRVPKELEPFFNGPGSPFEDFFGGGPRGEYQIPGAGSGFVISEDGHIVTNNHVVEEADEIEVAFKDGMTAKAKVIGRDSATDIALIKVDAPKPLAALPLGDSKALRPGDWVIAIGNPFGLEHTVTAGIVSALHRRGIGAGRYEDFIQTDAAINPGNSGGPLINLAGEVVGINTAINPRANTIGFAVPIDMAKEVLPSLRIAGSVTRGWLGVVIQQITPDIKEAMNLGDTRGALISRVDPSGPAQKAGIERGDVIVKFNGEPIDEMEELPRRVAGVAPGKKVPVVVRRAGKEKNFEVEVGKLDEGGQVASAEPQSEDGPTVFGLRVQDMTDELSEQLGVEGEKGVVVTEVENASPAAKAGMRRGDVILEVNQTEVTTAADFRKLSKEQDKLLLLVRRGEATIFVAVKKAGE
jgi:serine protease Do